MHSPNAMNKKQRIQQEKLLILSLLNESSEAISIGEIDNAIALKLNNKTLQRRLVSMVDEGLVLTVGERSNTKYFVQTVVNKHSYVATESGKYNTKNTIETKVADEDKNVIFSNATLSVLDYLQTPAYARKKSSYQFSVIDNYIPNQSQYIPNDMRSRLHTAGKRFNAKLAAGTYAKKISQRLLIDLSYHSSRLEGNTYSKLDTQKLIEEGLSAQGKIHEDTVMIMNHKEALQFLIENAEALSVNAITVRNIHALLSQDLMADPSACGNIRKAAVAISQSAYLPLSNPHQLDEYFSLVLRKAQQIEDPFEKSFFLLLHLSYLQAFEDVNKRTARLTCNIPFIQHNLCPLSFVDVPQDDYSRSLLYFYETNKIEPALELFEWAYLRSCEQYHVVAQSLGEIDVYRVKYRAQRKAAMGHIIRENLNEQAANEYLETYCKANDIPLSEKFINMTLSDLLHLHEGALVGLGVTEAMFQHWKSAQ